MKITFAAIVCLFLLASMTFLTACDVGSTPTITTGAEDSSNPFDDIEPDQVNLDNITVPFDGLADKLRTNEAATFGGLYDQGPQWVIYFTSNGDQTIRKYVPAENMFQISVRQSTFTLVQLETAQKSAINAFTTAGISTSSDIDLILQRVIIYVKSADLIKAKSVKTDPTSNIPVDIMTPDQRPAEAPWLQ